MKKVIHQAPPYPSKPQYMSAVWTQNEQQAEIAKRLAEEKRKPKLPILALNETKWFDAEDYHQKYVAKARGGVLLALMRRRAGERRCERGCALCRDYRRRGSLTV